MGLDIRNERQMLAATGFTKEQFGALAEAFGQVYEEDKKEKYDRACESGRRKRKSGGGRKSKLPTHQDKLEFILCYLKTCPTLDMLAVMFHLTTSAAYRHVHHLLGILHKTLEQLGVFPHRHFATPEEMKQALQGIDEIIIDVVERNHRRPVDNELQKDMYSGKKNDTQ